jgi:hydroxymethylbilane synthase
MDKIRIGTRNSQLAMWQAHYIENLLRNGGMDTEIVSMETKGDKILNVSLSKIGSKGVFTQELEEQLFDGTIDIAVHSAKDLPSSLPDGLEIIGFTEREIANDVLVSFERNLSLSDRDKNWVIGTSSTRRRAILRRNYPHITVVEARGNLQTRMRKMEEGHCHGLLLAYAGVHRMQYDKYIARMLSLEEFTPAVGQGSVAVEASMVLPMQKRDKIRQLINHPGTEVCLLAERAYLRRLEGGCSIPVFAMAQLDGNEVTLTGGIVSLDGSEIIQEEKTAHVEKVEELGRTLAERVLQLGGDRILAKIRSDIAGQ